MWACGFSILLKWVSVFVCFRKIHFRDAIFRYFYTLGWKVAHFSWCYCLFFIQAIYKIRCLAAIPGL
jgi:hypothetical protein